MTASVHLRAYGEPRSQGSKTAIVRGGRAVVVEGKSAKGRENLTSWRQAVATVASDWRADNPGAPLDEPVAIAATFWLSKPTSMARWRWLPWTGLDVDKLARALLDSLTGIVLRDDSRVTDLVVRKRFANPEAPGVSVVVVPLGNDERALFSPSLSLLTSVVEDWSERAEAVAR